MWKLEDILDLNFLSKLDDLSGSKRHQRDRKIYLDAQETSTPHSSHLERLQLWLAAERSSHQKSLGERIQGSSLAKSIHTFKILLIGAGFFLGAGTGLSYFVYTGKTPLNVFAFFSLFILPQLFIITLLLSKSLFIKLAQKPLTSSMSMLLQVFTKIIISLNRRGKRNRNVFAEHSSVDYFSPEERRILFYPLFLGSQLFGIALNLGLVAITALKIATSDLAFGWQTTLQIGADKLFSLVKLIATPWSWLLPQDIAYPSLEHIEGSRIILKDGIIDLATENLISWWPFLLLSLLIYGLLPRIVLAATAILMEKKINRSFLNSARFHQITERMQTPIVSTQAEPIIGQKIESDDTPINTSSLTREPCALNIEAHLCIPADLHPVPLPDVFKSYLQSQGFTIKDTFTIFQNYESDQTLLGNLSSTDLPIIIALEAWMAPIGEQLSFIEKMCAVNKSRHPVNILLLGKAKTDKLITPPQQHDISLWQDKISKRCKDIVYCIPQNYAE